MKRNLTVVLLLLSSNFSAQTSELAYESSGFCSDNLIQRDNFGIPSSQKVIDSVKIINDSTYYEAYHWTHARWHNGNPSGIDTIVFRNATPETVLYLYSEDFAKNFDNRFHSGDKSIIIYPKNSKILRQKANDKKYDDQKHTFQFVKKSSVSYLLSFIIIIGAVASLINRNAKQF
jgi:hypothetical protein